MTDEQINVTIATHLGWQAVAFNEGIGVIGIPPATNECDPVHLKSVMWTADLNAMHEALKTLKPDQLWDVAYSLPMETMLGFMATARELAETFLMVIGKWEATDKESLTVQTATTEQSSVDHLREATKMMEVQS